MEMRRRTDTTSDMRTSAQQNVNIFCRIGLMFEGK